MPGENLPPPPNPAPPKSPLPVIAFAIAILGALTFFLLIPPLIALLLAIAVSIRIHMNPHRFDNARLASWAITLSIVAACLGALLWIFLPSYGCGHCLSKRAYCAANLRGIEQCMIVFSSENDNQYPVVHYAPYSAALNSPTAGATETTAADAVSAYQKAPFPQAGSVTACLWILVLENQLTAQQFICKDDPFAKSPALVQSSAGAFYNNFQNDTQISYSAAYPWMADGSVGKWWTDTGDETLPVLADMAPQYLTGTPPHDLLSPTAPPKARNSANHHGDGQNVAFADCHVEFLRGPDVGQFHDNIWTSSASISKGPAASGGVPAGPWSPALTATNPPFDTVMYPVRNLTTGHL